MEWRQNRVEVSSLFISSLFPPLFFCYAELRNFSTSTQFFILHFSQFALRFNSIVDWIWSISPWMSDSVSVCFFCFCLHFARSPLLVAIAPVAFSFRLLTLYLSFPFSSLTFSSRTGLMVILLADFLIFLWIPPLLVSRPRSLHLLCFSSGFFTLVTSSFRLQLWLQSGSVFVCSCLIRLLFPSSSGAFSLFFYPYRPSHYAESILNFKSYHFESSIYPKTMKISFIQSI